MRSISPRETKGCQNTHHVVGVQQLGMTEPGIVWNINTSLTDRRPELINCLFIYRWHVVKYYYPN
jgi:hypothetical protein